MTHYVLAADNINGKEKSILEAMKKTMEAKGHQVTIAGVGPNVLQSYGKTSAATGTIGIQVVGGRCVGTAVDFLEGIGSYYKFKMMGFAFCSWTAQKYITCSDLKNYKFKGRAWDDGFSNEATLSKYKANTGKYSWSEWAAMYKSKLTWACGQSPEELARNLLKKSSGGGDDENSTPSSIKEALKKLLSYWDGEVECRIEGNQVFVNKIPAPNSDLKIQEGVNLVADSLTINDYFPDTVNVLTVHWKGEDIVLRDEKLINRFGEKPSELDAVKKITKTETKEVSSDTTSDDSSTDTTSTTTETITKIEEVPVETLEEAQHFADVEWAKIRRKNGHSIECKVLPSSKWKQGKWVKVEIPSYGEDGFMYINKVSHSDSADSNWSTSLTLVDYPPGFGEYQEDATEDDEEVEEIE